MRVHRGGKDIRRDYLDHWTCAPSPPAPATGRFIRFSGAIARYGRRIVVSYGSDLESALQGFPHILSLALMSDRCLWEAPLRHRKIRQDPISALTEASEISE